MTDTKDPLREALKRAESDFEYIRLRLIGYFEGQPAAAFWKAVQSRDAIRATLASAPQPAAVSQHERGEPRRFMDEIDAAHAGSAWLEPLAHALPKHPSNEISCEKVGNDGSVRLLWHKDIVQAGFLLLRDDANFTQLLTFSITAAPVATQHERCPQPSLTVVSFDYVNYRGEKSRRNVTPLELRFHSNEYHKEPQFLLRAIDVDKGEEREFALRDMSNVLPDIFLTGSSKLPWSAAPVAAQHERGSPSFEMLELAITEISAKCTARGKATEEPIIDFIERVLPLAPVAAQHERGDTTPAINTALAEAEWDAGDPKDVCECGDYRNQHDQEGRCTLNKLGHGGAPDCVKFRFAKAALPL